MTRPYKVVDFRDKHGVSRFSCPVCGNTASWWDPQTGSVFHIPDTRSLWSKVPCNAKIGL